MSCIDHGYQGTPRGYARPMHNGKLEYKHRTVYAAKVGRSISELAAIVVRHTCDNPRCINPDHLIEGTQHDNLQDQVDRKRNHKLPRIFTHEQRAAIQKRYIPNDPHCGISAMAREYKASTATIHRIINGARYYDVAPAQVPGTV